MRGRPILTAGAAAGLALLAAACGTNNTGTTKTTAAPTTTYAPINAPAIPPGSGPVDVLYAESLAGVMAKVGPALNAATGYTFVGYPASSGALERAIKGRAKQGDVLVGASSSVDAALEGATNGSWVTWYATFATTAAYRYTVTVLNRAPHPYAADAFVEFLLGARGEGLLSKLNFDILLPPRVTGPVPTALNSVLPTS